jgi:hypothetical protein
MELSEVDDVTKRSRQVSIPWIDNGEPPEITRPRVLLFLDSTLSTTCFYNGNI